MSRTSRVSAYVSVYLCVCLLGNLGLVVVFLLGSTTTPTSPLLLHQRPASHTDNDVKDGMSCADISSFSNHTIIGSGWTKLVYRSKYNGVNVAVKTVHTNGHDMTECTEAPSVCYQHCAEKIIKEIQLLQVLAHPNIIKVYEECVPDDEYSVKTPVAVVMELGQPITVLHLLQMSYDQRLGLARDVSRLLLHLSTSPLGPILMRDFRREQFVLVDGTLKLSDVDDVVAGEPHCVTSSECLLKDPATDAILVTLPCVGSVCREFNSRLNALQAGQHFLRLLLPYDGPPPLEHPAMHLMAQLAQGMEDSQGLHQSIETLVTNYSGGLYLTQYQKDSIKDYVASEGLSVVGWDFPCSKTDVKICQQFVSSPEEAAWLCSQWSQCRAFVLLHRWSWSGRQMAVFKSRAGNVAESPKETLYIRRGQG